MKAILQELEAAVDEVVRLARPTREEMFVFRLRLLSVLDQLDTVLALNQEDSPVLNLRRQLVRTLNKKQQAQDAALQGYRFETTDRELLVTRPDTRPFVYDPDEEQDQLVQKMLFEEKFKLIRKLQKEVRLLSAADRLRLRIELLLSAYYEPGNVTPEFSSEVCYLNAEEVRPEYRLEPPRVLVTGEVPDYYSL